MKEADVLKKVRIHASAKGTVLWRNNVGATYARDGSFIRYGLANESASMNELLKSSDLIGITPVIITQEMVGKTIGQFTAREAKHSGWIYTGTHREKAQLAYINLVLSLGGDAKFTTGEI